MFKIIIINAKRGLFFARAQVDATWRSRPCGSATRTRAYVPAWHWGDVYISYIYILHMVHSKYKHPYIGFKLTAIYVSSYIPVSSLKFPPCGTKFPLISSLQDAWHSMKRWMKIAINCVRRCDGRMDHAIRDQRTCLNTPLSELIGAVHFTNYNGYDWLKPMDSRCIVTARLTSNGRIRWNIFSSKQRGYIMITRQRSDDHKLIASFRSKGVWSEPSIAMNTSSDGRASKSFFTTERRVRNHSSNSLCLEHHFTCHLLHCVRKSFPLPMDV